MRARAVAALCGAAVALAGCGSDSDGPPRGPAAERVGRASIETLVTVERARAALVAAVDVYGLGGPARERPRDDALAYLARAREAYEDLRPRVEDADAVLDREIVFALDTAEDDISGRRRFDIVRDRLSAVRGQLFDGVTETLVSRGRRDDPGLVAEALVQILDLLQVEYEAGATSAGVEARRRTGLAYGLLARSQALVATIADELGDDGREDVGELLSGLREDVWPDGISPQARAPLQDVTAATRDAGALVVERFGL